MADHDDDTLTPAEQRVAELVAQLRGDRRDPPQRLTEQVMHTARWQRAVRGTLVTVGQLISALGAGLELLVDNRPGRGSG